MFISFRKVIPLKDLIDLVETQMENRGNEEVQEWNSPSPGSTTRSGVLKDERLALGEVLGVLKTQANKSQKDIAEYKCEEIKNNIQFY